MGQSLHARVPRLLRDLVGIPAFVQIPVRHHNLLRHSGRGQNDPNEWIRVKRDGTQQLVQIRARPR
jgi:hypothetical protein